MTLSSICTSELHIKHGAVPKALPGITVGHEMVGMVKSVSSEVKKIMPGDRVAANVETFCWNPAISSYTEERCLEDFELGFGVGNWNVYEYQKLRPGDIHQNFTINSFGEVGLLAPDALVKEILPTLA